MKASQCSAKAFLLFDVVLIITCTHTLMSMSQCLSTCSLSHSVYNMIMSSLRINKETYNLMSMKQSVMKCVIQSCIVKPVHRY